MYERSAIVLERYLDEYFGYTKENNLKANYQNYKDIVEEMKQYRDILIEEDGLIKQFDEVAKTIQEIQIKQSKLYESNLKMEEERNKLFNDLSENPSKLEANMEKVEKTIEKNNQELIGLREEYIKAVEIFIERQKERNKVTRKRRVVEENHIGYLESVTNSFTEIDEQCAKKVKEFANLDKEEITKEIINTMIKNGKNEKLGFNKDVISKAVEVRISIAEKESECYATIFDRTKKLMQEVENEDIKLAKYEKVLRDISVKLSFLEAEKEYIVAFLDNERMTAISGPKAHKKMMEEACDGFEADIVQINNLYELIIKETTNKATKKAYKELYNKTYLKNIEEKEKNFEQEVNNIKIRMGTLINSNYWRIEGIKNIYTVFQEEVSTKFEKDLSEFKLELDGVEEMEKTEEVEPETKETQKKEKGRKKVQKVDEEIEEEKEDLPKAIKNMRKSIKIELDELADEDDFDDVNYEETEEYEDEDYENEDIEDEFDEEDEFDDCEDDESFDDSDEDDLFDDEDDDEFFDDEEDDDEDDDEFFDDEEDFDDDEDDFFDDEDDEYESDDDDFEIDDDEDEDSEDDFEIDDDEEEEELEEDFEIDDDEEDYKGNKKKNSGNKTKAKEKKEDDNKGLFNKLFKK